MEVEEMLFFSWFAVVMLTLVLAMVVFTRLSKRPCNERFGETHNFVAVDDDHAVCDLCGLKLKRLDRWVRDYSK